MQWWKQQTPTPAPTPAAKPPPKPAEQAPKPQLAPTPPPAETELEPSAEPQVETPEPVPAGEADPPEPRAADRPEPREADLPQTRAADRPQRRTEDRPQVRTAERPQARTAVAQPPPRPAVADDDGRSVGEAIDEAIGSFERSLADMKDQANDKRVELADLERDIKRLEKDQAKSLKQMLGSNPAIRKMLNPKRKSPRRSRKATKTATSESESVFE